MSMTGMTVRCPRAGSSQHLEARRCDNWEPQGTGERLRRGDADAKTGEEPRTDVDRYGVELSWRDPRDPASVRDRGMQRLGLATTGTSRDARQRPDSSATAAPTSMVAVSMARILTLRPPFPRPTASLRPRPVRSRTRPGLEGNGPQTVGPPSRDAPRARRRRRAARPRPPFDDHDSALVEILLQREVDHLCRCPRRQRSTWVTGGEVRYLWASVKVGLVTGSRPPSAATKPWTNVVFRRRATRRAAPRRPRSEEVRSRHRSPGSVARSRSRPSPALHQESGSPSVGAHRRNFFARMRSARISATTTPPPRSA